jgi:hypothetical protein
MAEFPAPNDPAIGAPMLWADEEADIPTITVSARATLIEAFNMESSLRQSAFVMPEPKVERLAAGTIKLGFRKQRAVRWLATAPTAPAGSNVCAHRRSYRRLEDFQPGLVADRNEVPRLTEPRPFGSNALSYEFRMFFRFLPGFALVPQDVMRGKLADEIKEKPLHGRINAALKCLFLHKKLTGPRELIGVAFRAKSKQRPSAPLQQQRAARQIPTGSSAWP